MRWLFVCLQLKSLFPFSGILKQTAAGGVTISLQVKNHRLPQSLCRVLDARPLAGLQHILEEVLVVAVVGFLVQKLIVGLLLHLFRWCVVLTVSPPLPFGPTHHRASVAWSLISVGPVCLRAGLLVLDHYQIGRHFLELIDEPLPLHFSQDASLIVVPAAESASF